MVGEIPILTICIAVSLLGYVALSEINRRK